MPSNIQNFIKLTQKKKLCSHAHETLLLDSTLKNSQIQVETWKCTKIGAFPSFFPFTCLPQVFHCASCFQ